MRELIARHSLAVLIVAILLLVMRREVFSPSPFVVAGQLAGIALILSARISFGKQTFHITAQPADGPLLERGPYRYVRHPMYAGALLFVLSSVLGHLSVLSAVLLLLVAVTLLLRIHVEEQILGERYPEYTGYMARTWKVIPFLF